MSTWMVTGAWEGESEPTVRHRLAPGRVTPSRSHGKCWPGCGRAGLHCWAFFPRRVSCHLEGCGPPFPLSLSYGTQDLETAELMGDKIEEVCVPIVSEILLNSREGKDYAFVLQLPQKLSCSQRHVHASQSESGQTEVTETDHVVVVRGWGGGRCLQGANLEYPAGGAGVHYATCPLESC